MFAPFAGPTRYAPLCNLQAPVLTSKKENAMWIMIIIINEPERRGKERFPCMFSCWIGACSLSMDEMWRERRVWLLKNRSIRWMAQILFYFFFVYISHRKHGSVVYMDISLKRMKSIKFFMRNATQNWGKSCLLVYNFILLCIFFCRWRHFLETMVVEILVW